METPSLYRGVARQKRRADHTGFIAKYCRDQRAVGAEKALLADELIQRLKQERACRAQPASEREDLRIEDIADGRAGGAEMVEIGAEDGQCRLVSGLGAVGDELGRDFCCVAAGLLRQKTFGMRLHGPAAVAREDARRAVGFHAAVIAAGTWLAAVDKIGMPQFNAVIHAAVEHFAVQDDAAAKPRAERQQNASLMPDERALVELCQRRTVGVVGNVDGDAEELRLQDLLERDLVEVQIVRVKDHLAACVDAAGDDRADRLHVMKFRAAAVQKRQNGCADLLRHVLRRRVRERDGADRCKLQRLVQKTDLNIGAADVNADLIHKSRLFPVNREASGAS